MLFSLDGLKSLARVAKLERLVEDYFRQNLYITRSGMWRSNYLQRAVNVVEPGAFSIPSDYPYQYRLGALGKAFLEQTGLAAGHQELFAHGNWEHLMESVAR